MLFHRFPDSVWTLRTIKIKYVYYNRAFPQISITGFFEKSEGGLGAYRLRKFWDLDAWKIMLFSLFSRQYLGLKTIKMKTILTIFYVYYNRSSPQNLNLWLLEKSEIINLQMLIQKKYIQCFKFKFSFWKNVLSNVCLGFFNVDAILAHAKAWDLVLWKCPRRSTTLRSASTFYTSAKRLTHLKLLKCALTYSHTWAGYFTVIFAGSFHYFKLVSCWILFCENVTGIPEPSINFHRMRERQTYWRLRKCGFILTQTFEAVSHNYFSWIFPLFKVSHQN